MFSYTDKELYKNPEAAKWLAEVNRLVALEAVSRELEIGKQYSWLQPQQQVEKVKAENFSKKLLNLFKKLFTYPS